MFKGFHFLVEGDAGKIRTGINEWELGSRLSFSLRSTMPDEPLLAAARSTAFQIVTLPAGQISHCVSELGLQVFLINLETPIPRLDKGQHRHCVAVWPVQHRRCSVDPAVAVSNRGIDLLIADSTISGTGSIPPAETQTANPTQQSTPIDGNVVLVTIRIPSVASQTLDRADQFFRGGVW